MLTLLEISAFHDLRRNSLWTEATAAEQAAALARARDYQGAFYPVRDPLTPVEVAVFQDAMALLALEMLNPPASRAERGIKSLKEAGDGLGSVETVYDGAPQDPFPIITAMMVTLAPRAHANAAVRFSRMRP